MMRCSYSTTTRRLFNRHIPRIHFESPVCKSRNTLLKNSTKQFSQSTIKNQRTSSTPESSADQWVPFERSPLQSATICEKVAKSSTTKSQWTGDAAEQPTSAVATALAYAQGFEAGVNEGSQKPQDSLECATWPVSENSAVLEINPETIAALAAESVKKRGYERSRSRRRESALHYNSPPTASIGSQNTSHGRKTADSRVSKDGGKAVKSPHSPKEPWQIQKVALKEKFAEGWNPRKRLSPDALKGIRAIHAQYPKVYTTSVLAEKFEVSAEAIRRILKSKWTPKEDEEADRNRRWFVRGTKVWSRWAEMGIKPPARWRSIGVGRESNQQ